jgi:hypothetical protein
MPCVRQLHNRCSKAGIGPECPGPFRVAAGWVQSAPACSFLGRLRTAVRARNAFKLDHPGSQQIAFCSHAWRAGRRGRHPVTSMVQREIFTVATSFRRLSRMQDSCTRSAPVELSVQSLPCLPSPAPDTAASGLNLHSMSRSCCRKRQASCHIRQEMRN